MRTLVFALAMGVGVSASAVCETEVESLKDGGTVRAAIECLQRELSAEQERNKARVRSVFARRPPPNECHFGERGAMVLGTESDGKNPTLYVCAKDAKGQFHWAEKPLVW